MEKKSEKRLFTVTRILAILFIILLVLSAVLLFGEEGEKKGGNGNAGPFVIKDTEKEDSEKTPSDVLGEEGTDDTEEKGNGITMVIDGFKMIVPSDYNCFYNEKVGPVVYIEDVFQMKTVIKEESYEEMMRNPDGITEGTIAAGGEILQEVREKEINGRKYAYFRMRLRDVEYMIVQTKAADTDKRIAAQFAIETDDLTDEDILNVFVSIASTATVTDEANSTLDDIVEQLATPVAGEKKTTSILSFEGETVRFHVSDGFYSQATDRGSMYAVEFFSLEDAVMTDCYLWSSKTGDYENAEAIIENSLDNLLDNVKKETEIQKLEIEGITYYYIDTHYEFNGSDYQKICAACDVGKSGIYVVETEAIDFEEEISMDTIREFLILEYVLY